jgi:hypothetical protein
MKRKRSLNEKYPPSEPCSCPICVSYCQRPGWWTVKEAGAALDAGYGKRMMLEVSPEFSLAVLSPAFKGCEGNFALNLYAERGCNFMQNQRCELHSTGFQPLECRYCHHERRGMGEKCHQDLEKDWNTLAGRQLVEQWIKLTGFREKQYLLRSGLLK